MIGNYSIRQPTDFVHGGGVWGDAMKQVKYQGKAVISDGLNFMFYHYQNFVANSSTYGAGSLIWPWYVPCGRGVVHNPSQLIQQAINNHDRSYNVLFEDGSVKTFADASNNVAEAAMFESLTEYAVSIANVHYRKGSLLEYNGVYLAEGPWPGKAYFDAHRRARQRDASMYLDYGFTRPNVLSRGPYDQHAEQGQSLLGDGEPIYDVIQGGEAFETQPEEIPAPAPGEPGVLPKPTPAVPLPPEAAAAGAGAGGRPAGGPRLGAVGTSAVRQVSYEQTGPDIFAGNSRLSSQGWKSTNRPSTANAASSNPPIAQTDRSASGWSGIQR